MVSDSDQRVILNRKWYLHNLLLIYFGNRQTHRHQLTHYYPKKVLDTDDTVRAANIIHYAVALNKVLSSNFLEPLCCA